MIFVPFHEFLRDATTVEAEKTVRAIEEDDFSELKMFHAPFKEAYLRAEEHLKITIHRAISTRIENHTPKSPVTSSFMALPSELRLMTYSMLTEESLFMLSACNKILHEEALRAIFTRPRTWYTVNPGATGQSLVAKYVGNIVLNDQYWSKHSETFWDEFRSTYPLVKRIILPYQNPVRMKHSEMLKLIERTECLDLELIIQKYDEYTHEAKSAFVRLPKNATYRTVSRRDSTVIVLGDESQLPFDICVVDSDRETGPLAHIKRLQQIRQPLLRTWRDEIQEKFKTLDFNRIRHSIRTRKWDYPQIMVQEYIPNLLAFLRMLEESGIKGSPERAKYENLFELESGQKLEDGLIDFPHWRVFIGRYSMQKLLADNDAWLKEAYNVPKSK